MAIIVNTNMNALNTRSHLNNATIGLSRSLERISSGLKVNRAKDDAADLDMATKINSQIRGSSVAQDNIALGRDIVQAAEGDLNTILDHLNRVRDLAVQASNGIYDSNGLAAIQAEVTARWEEIDRVANASNFNGMKLLAKTGSISEVRLQVGANSDAAVNMIKVMGVFGDTTSETGLGIKNTNAFKGATAAAQYIGTIDNAINSISTKRSTIGAIVNRLDSADASLTTTIENAIAAKSTLIDADIATESMEFTRNQILQQTSTALLSQANQLPAIALSLVS